MYAISKETGTGTAPGNKVLVRLRRARPKNQLTGSPFQGRSQVSGPINDCCIVSRY